MDHRTATALAAVAAAALLLADCTDDASPAAAAAVPSTSSPSTSSVPPPTSSASYGLLGEQTAVRTCTEIGNSEGVSVDLSATLAQDGGDHAATVSLPALGASETTGFAGDEEHHPVAGVEADLTDAPTTVVVSVADASGREVYRASGVGRPILFQPNGAECDGENYRISLVATPDHQLVAR